jgi:glycosyltransferase involved in cell wall biosynthesis
MLQLLRGRISITVFRFNVKEGTSQDTYENLELVRTVDVGIAGQPDYGKILNEVSREGQFDVIHIQHEYSIFPADAKFLDFLRELKRHCCQLIVTLHNVRHPLHYPGIEKFQRKLCEIVDVVIVHSSLQEMELLHQGASQDKIVRIPHGTRIARLVSKLDALKELNLNIPSNFKIILVQGFLRRDKGLHIVLEAMDLLLNKYNYREAVLLVAGQIQGPEANKDYVTEFLNKLKRIEGHFIVLNKYLTRREIDLVYSAADLIVFPYVDVSGDIGVSGAFHLALGSFKPILCARVPRLIECYELAPRLTFPPQNPEALAAKMYLVLTNYERVLSYMKPLIQYAHETNWINVAKIHLRLYAGEEPYMVDLHYEKLPHKTEYIKVSKKVPSSKSTSV